MGQNHEGSLEHMDKPSEMKVAVNSMQRTAFVQRMARPEQTRLSRKEIIQYDIDNLYPNKAKSIAERSVTTMASIGVLSSFIYGAGFIDDDLNELVVNEDGQTLVDIHEITADDEALFNGYAIHVNYNVLGQIIELNEISFELLRWNYDQSRVFWCKDWTKARFSGKNKNVVEYFPFDPEKVGDQIDSLEENEEFNGQIIYWVPRKKDIYTLCRFDAAMEDAQFQAESKLWKLSNIQNGYAANYVLFYPAQIESGLEKAGLIKDVKGASGSANAGRTNAIPVNASAMEALKGRNVIEEIPRTGVDKLFTKQNEEAKADIYTMFQQPPILSGTTKDGGFSKDEYVDAFDTYNTFTEKNRSRKERIFQKILDFSVWGSKKVEIKPKQFIIHREKDETEITPEETKKTEVIEEETNE